MNKSDDTISRQVAIDALRYAQHRFTVADEAGGMGTVKWSEDVIYFAAAENVLTNLPSAQQWIPVSERLPKEHESIWAKAKGTERWSESMWEKQSDEVIVTELFENGTTRTDTACTHDGEWYVKIKAVKRKIIAWMPLPEPWKGE